MSELQTVGGIAQLGSFALVVYLTYWLSTWVPRRMEHADAVRKVEADSRKALGQSHQAAVERISSAHQLAIKESLLAFAEQQQFERESRERLIRELQDRYDKRHQIMMDLYVKLRDDIRLRLYEKMSEISHEQDDTPTDN